MALSTCVATREERHRTLPGDTIVADPIQTITHAVTIDASPSDVWPWLAQMGGGRAGWYSYDWIDNGGRPSATTIVPELQDVHPGDIFPAVPGAKDVFVVEKADPPRNLILTVPDLQGGNVGSWEFSLEPVDGGRTRLLARVRIASAWATRPKEEKAAGPQLFIERIYGLLDKMPRPLMLGVGAFGQRLMEARMLRGIKRRSESAPHTIPQAAARAGTALSPLSAPRDDA